jgi:hypothetical protein
MGKVRFQGAPLIHAENNMSNPHAKSARPIDFHGPWHRQFVLGSEFKRTALRHLGTGWALALLLGDCLREIAHGGNLGSFKQSALDQPVTESWARVLVTNFRLGSRFEFWRVFVDPSMLETPKTALTAVATEGPELQNHEWKFDPVPGRLCESVKSEASWTT